MGRKQKRGSKQSTVPHKEALMRMNFLLQASLAALSVNPAHPELSRFYVHTMRSVSKRLVLRMDPSVKRMLCKSCDTLLVSGVTCTHRIRARREKHVAVRCLTCGAVKRFLARADYQLWSENPANVVPQPTTTVPQPTTTVPKPTTTVPPLTTVPAPSSTSTTSVPSVSQSSSSNTCSSRTTETPPSNNTVLQPTIKINDNIALQPNDV